MLKMQKACAYEIAALITEALNFYYPAFFDLASAGPFIISLNLRSNSCGEEPLTSSSFRSFNTPNPAEIPAILIFLSPLEGLSPGKFCIMPCCRILKTFPLPPLFVLFQKQRQLLLCLLKLLNIVFFLILSSESLEYKSVQGRIYQIGNPTSID